jgi:hypothetical protein
MVNRNSTSGQTTASSAAKQAHQIAITGFLYKTKIKLNTNKEKKKE